MGNIIILMNLHYELKSKDAIVAISLDFLTCLWERSNSEFFILFINIIITALNGLLRTLLNVPYQNQINNTEQFND